jgi:coenzyme F420 hydrogenase subunit beta
MGLGGSELVVKIFGHLLKDVIRNDLCIGCGACVAACPSYVLRIFGEVPVMKEYCHRDGFCYHQCPQTVDPKELERRVFGRNAGRDEPFGIYRQVFSVKARAPDILARCQDGGAVTGLLAELLETGYIDAAIEIGTGDLPWQPAPKVVLDRDDVLACAGTKYSRGAVIFGLRDAVDLYMREQIAVVGTPCEIKALRQMQTGEHSPYRLTDNIKLCIGLFCRGTWPYARLRRILEGQYRINLAEVAKFDIKRGQFLIYRHRKPKRMVPLKSMRKFVYGSCKVCPDFAAELADISIGAAGSPLGRSTVLLRTPAGVEAFEQAGGGRVFDVKSLEEVKPGAEAIEMNSKLKRRIAQEEIERRRKEGEPLPPWLLEKPTPT